jgi:hypothetical protein
MDQHSERRVEEELFMNNFEDDFAYRHKTTLRIIANKINLEYVVIDCAETRDGKFILFEASNIALVHAIDPSSIYPYKKPIMNKVFTAFRNMCVARHPTKQ